MLAMRHAAALAAAAAGVAADAPLAPLVMLTDPKARCMDGTQAGYYFSPASSAADKGNWVFHLQGGGECTSESACKAKLNSELGSSKYFSKNGKRPRQLTSGDPAENPVLYTWNRVFVAYCSQDLHSGTVTTPTNDTWGLYFAGHLIVRAIVADLRARADLGAAQNVVLSGASAGGIGAWVNLDFFKDEFPSARLVAAPIAGYYFFAYPYTGPGHTQSDLADFSPEAWPHHVALWHSHLPPKCAAALGDGKAACMLSNYSAPYNDIPVFVIEAQTDKVQLVYHDWVPNAGVLAKQKEVIDYMLDWKANQTQGMKAVLKPQDGYFNPACFMHTDFTNGFPVLSDASGKRLSYVQAFGEWFFNNSHVTLMDDCAPGTVMCNVHCPDLA
eukprot:TRINITY_DN5893_c0_g1_i1.p1 TRINITY_DN5893_c0_g1~~TRINITY_DN5893_c0_g1_i1.p1  ORF type:complete len:410 (+),score=114.86 TRINITY_DN5893_c0_g1_i1:75-1232(+)